MILDRVTFTGADDSVDPEALVRISGQFPFVEWGILFSAKWQSTPRYPSHAWLTKFRVVNTAAYTDVVANYSAHLCGRWVREAMAGAKSWWLEFQPITDRFKRIQLNFHGEPHAFAANLPDGHQYILQWDGKNDGMVMNTVGNSSTGKFVPLFDRSGGAGELPLVWPRSLFGGLSPANVVEQVSGPIADAAGPARVWIDMERRVRSDDDTKFDLDKVLSVLTQLVEKGLVSV